MPIEQAFVEEYGDGIHTRERYAVEINTLEELLQIVDEEKLHGNSRGIVIQHTLDGNEYEIELYRSCRE